MSESGYLYLSSKKGHMDTDFTSHFMNNPLGSTIYFTTTVKHESTANIVLHTDSTQCAQLIIKTLKRNVTGILVLNNKSTLEITDSQKQQKMCMRDKEYDEENEDMDPNNFNYLP
ncbi:hypothetical protein ACJX0J_034785 [Zea mays]